MSAIIIDGKAHAAKLRERVAAQAAALKAEHGIVPGLATVLVGNDPASEIYIRNKGKVAEAIGFRSLHRTMPADASALNFARAATSSSPWPDPATASSSWVPATIPWRNLPPTC